MLCYNPITEAEVISTVIYIKPHQQHFQSLILHYDKNLLLFVDFSCFIYKSLPFFSYTFI